MIGRLSLSIAILCGLGAAAHRSAAAEALPPPSASGTPERHACNDSLKSRFKPDALTSVILVEQVRKGDPFPNPTMEQMVYPGVPATYGADLCHVKLLIGPGNPGPADAPSTSRGIGIEVWLPEPSVWNRRVHAIGGSGATGSAELVKNRISEWTGAIDTRSAPRVAAEEAEVTSTTDSGRGTDRSDSSWMYPDGSINFFAIRDWNYRALLEQAVKTKALAQAYYGIPAEFSYFDGASGGGRQALHIAQKLPNAYDGIVAGVPALAFAETMSHSYPGIVILRDLDGIAPTKDQLSLVSNAAIASCDMVGGQHLGFVLDNRSCRYDPTRDAAVLCVADGGRNATKACLSRKLALAINKFWYGPTRDGTVPDPAVDNGWDSAPGGNRLWWGVPRGTDLSGWATINSVPGMDVAAIVMGNPAVASLSFRNAKGNGSDAWRAWTYEEFGRAFDRLRDGQQLLDISSADPDLDAFKAGGGKLLIFVHLNDSVLPPQPAMAYYDAVSHRMGGPAVVQSFFRQYMIPGQGHGGDGTANPEANSPAATRGQLYRYLRDWVEKGSEPRNIIFASKSFEGEDVGSVLDRQPAGKPRRIMSLPACAYPQRPVFVRGDIRAAGSYSCR